MQCGMVKGHDFGMRVRGDQMGTESKGRKSFLLGLGWNVGSWDAQDGLRGAPGETFQKRLSQIVGKWSPWRCSAKAAVTLEGTKSREGTL